MCVCAVCESDIKKTRLENKFLLCELDTSVYTIFCDCVTVVMKRGVRWGSRGSARGTPTTTKYLMANRIPNFYYAMRTRDDDDGDSAIKLKSSTLSSKGVFRALLVVEGFQYNIWKSYTTRC